VNGTQLDPRQT
jgi:hypothetical protein